MKNGSQELTLLKKEFNSDFSIFWSQFCICIKKIAIIQNIWSEIFRKGVKLIFSYQNKFLRECRFYFPLSLL